MLIARRPESAHWYLPDGTPFYEVPNVSSGGMRPATIRDAFKSGAFRSVTNVLDVLGKPGLVKWKIEQALLSALTLPRIDGEDDHSFAARALMDSEEQSRKAAEFGTRLHDAAAQYLTKHVMPADEELARLLGPFIVWCKTHLLRVIASEQIVVNPIHYYAGRLDIAVQFIDGSYGMLDIKTQEVKLSEKGQPKPAFYDEWALQLGAYAECDIQDEGGMLEVIRPEWRLFSLVMDRTRPGIYPKEWPEGKHFEAFASACVCWEYLKGGVPGRDGKAA